jgi:RES domain
MSPIPLPPSNPPSNLNPDFVTLNSEEIIRRIYKDKNGRSEKTFNYKGPYGRFDHHRHTMDNPQVDSDRGVSYWGYTLSCCLVEIFGDQKFIAKEDRQTRRAGILTISQPMLLLNLCGSGAMRVGSTTKIAKDSAREDTQAWSRYFYDHTQIFKQVDGLIYANSHNDEKVICFYERAISKLKNADSCNVSLDSQSLQAEIQKTCLDNGMNYLNF